MGGFSHRGISAVNMKYCLDLVAGLAWLGSERLARVSRLLNENPTREVGDKDRHTSRKVTGKFQRPNPRQSSPLCGCERKNASCDWVNYFRKNSLAFSSIDLIALSIS